MGNAYENKAIFSPSELRYLRLLAKQYPTLQDASNEAIRLEAILNLPKGTEHFMSDIHGEHEAFLHILNTSSGEVKEKLNEYFAETLSEQDRNELATLIYYPEAKLNMVMETATDVDDWYLVTMHQLVQFCRYVSVKHTCAKVRSYIPAGYESLIDELINLCNEDGFLLDQYSSILVTIIRLGQANAVIDAICTVIKTLTCDHLHIVGDIFDRGPRADIVMDCLMEQPNGK